MNKENVKVASNSSTSGYWEVVQNPTWAELFLHQLANFNNSYFYDFDVNPSLEVRGILHPRLI